MITIQVRRAGGPEVLEVVDAEEPAPSPGYMVVQVEAAGVNFVDTYRRAGLYPMDMPFVPGVEGAGRVVAVGEGVDGFAEGDRIAWTDTPGSYAQYASVPAERAVPIPDEVGTEQAAAVMLQGLTAHYLATSTFALAPGHRCLVHAGAGGVGRLLVQIAKLKGAEVFATVGSPDKAEVASSAGADHVIEYRKVPFQEAVEAIAGERPLDVVYDGVGATTFDAGLTLLRRRGLMVTFGNASGAVPPVAPLVLSRNGSLFLTRPTLADYIHERAELLGRTNDLFSWMESGDLDVLIGATHPLVDAAAAQHALESRATVGKVLLIP